jgi:hypothetical protein
MMTPEGRRSALDPIDYSARANRAVIFFRSIEKDAETHPLSVWSNAKSFCGCFTRGIQVMVIKSIEVAAAALAVMVLASPAFAQSVNEMGSMLPHHYNSDGTKA